MKNLRNYLQSLYCFILQDIWKVTEAELSRGKRIAYRFIKIIHIAFRGIQRDNLVVRASALTYSLLFALVPLIALFIAIGKGFGVEDIIKDWLEEVLVAQKELIPTIMGFVERYLETTSGGLFIGVGIFILLISVMNFFKQAEQTFNSIWEVNKSRSLFRQFSTYFSALLLIPLLVVLAGGVSIFFNTLISNLQLEYILSPLLHFGMKLTPYLISWLLFTVMYILIPNTRVQLRNAAIAGVVAGTAFQFFQNIYISGQVYLARYDVVYGSFAAIPLLLLWLQISCLIILLGAEIAYASQNLHNYEYEGDSKNISVRYKNFVTLFLTYIIVKQFENNLPPLKNDTIAATYRLPIRLVNQLLNELTAIKIITEITDDDDKTKAYQPALDIHQLTVRMLLERIESNGSELFLSNKHDQLDQFWLKNHTLLQIKNTDEQLLIKDL